MYSSVSTRIYAQLISESLVQKDICTKSKTVFLHFPNFFVDSVHNIGLKGDDVTLRNILTDGLNFSSKRLDRSGHSSYIQKSECKMTDYAELDCSTVLYSFFIVLNVYNFFKYMYVYSITYCIFINVVCSYSR